jgi:hypothetical protein
MAMKYCLITFFIYAYGGNFGGALWQGDNAMVMH